MKEIARMALQQGMVLGKDVIYQGHVLYPADTRVNKEVIDKLNRYSIMCVTIKEAVDYASTHYEKMRYNERFLAFEQKYNLYLKLYKDIMSLFIKTGTKPKDEELLSIYYELTSEISSGTQVLDYLYNLVPDEDILTHTQCLNAALLAGTFADWTAMRQEEKDVLLLCAFYYDIGKLKIPYSILWKSSKLSDAEYELVKKHPRIGHLMLRELDLDSHVKNATLMHHERMDGSGYPQHLEKSQIDIYARYMAIIDTYIAMASPRSYRLAQTPLQILYDFEKNMPQYDIELLIPLMKRIADAQIGTRVQLNDDSIWEVMIIHPNHYSRPILRNESNEIIDLMKQPELFIIKNL